MPKRPSRFRVAVLATLAVFAVGLLALHLRHPLPYVYRVYVYQDPDFSDVHRFPSRAIAAPESPSELPIHPGSRVAQVVEQHPEVEDLGSLLEETLVRHLVEAGELVVDD